MVSRVCLVHPDRRADAERVLGRGQSVRRARAWGPVDVPPALLRRLAHNDAMYRFVDAHGFGDSEFGRLMDAAGRSKGVMAHRLFGHHAIYNFPLSDLSQAPEFTQHLLSDVFTKQGLPIIPGEVVRSPALLKACDGLTNNWNFVNGFDLLTATVSIYTGVRRLQDALSGKICIETIEEAAKEFGVTALNFAIAISTCNPFALIGAAIHLAATVKGALNDGCVLFFQEMHGGITLSVVTADLALEQALARHSLDAAIAQTIVTEALRRTSFDAALMDICRADA